MERCCKIGEYNCYRLVLNPLDKNRPISIDMCLIPEIYSLWNRGIKTVGCCCGHFQNEGFIQVDPEFVEQMKNLGYEQLPLIRAFDGSLMGYHAFKPKTNFGEFEGYITNKINKESEIIECRWCQSFGYKPEEGSDNIVKCHCKTLDREVSPLFHCGFAKEVGADYERYLC